MPAFDIVVAADARRGIGRAGALPWKLAADMEYFRRLTSSTGEPGRRNAVVMGRKTWQSIPDRFRPLKGRLNIVLSASSSLSLPDGVLHCRSLEQALKAAEEHQAEKVFVIGGAEVYALALDHPSLARVYMTEIEGDHRCDTFFPVLPAQFELLSRSEEMCENGVKYCFSVYARKPGWTAGPDML